MRIPAISGFNPSNERVKCPFIEGRTTFILLRISVLSFNERADVSTHAYQPSIMDSENGDNEGDFLRLEKADFFRCEMVERAR